LAYPYHLREWVVDWSNVLEATTKVPKEKANEHLRKVFSSRYTDAKEAQWKCTRILNALDYMKANVDSFEKAGLLIASSKSGTVGKHLSFALYRFFGYVDDIEVKTPPSPQVFIDAAEQDRQHFG
jgi:hypothetical protein